MSFDYDEVERAISLACTHIKRKHQFQSFGAFRIRTMPRGGSWSVFCEATDIECERDFRSEARKALSMLDNKYPDAISVGIKFECLIGGKTVAGSSKNVTVKSKTKGVNDMSGDSKPMVIFSDGLQGIIPKGGGTVVNGVIDGMDLGDLRVAYMMLASQLESMRQSREFERSVMGRQMAFVENVMVETQRTNRTLTEQTMGALRDQHEAQVRAEVIAEIGAAATDRNETRELMAAYQPVISKAVEAVLGNRVDKGPTMDAGKLASDVWAKIAKDLDSEPGNVRGLFESLTDNGKSNLFVMMLEITGADEGDSDEG